jgi:hypothetical protein
VTRFVKLRLRCLDEMRRVYFTRVSTQLGFIRDIKQQPLPQLVTGHVKMIVSLGPQRTLVTGTKTEPVTVKSIGDAYGKPASPMSRQTGHVVGPTG